MREFSRMVGVSQRAPYRHFKDKGNLLANLAAEGFRELAAALHSPKVCSNPVLGVGLVYINFASSNRRLFGLMFGPLFACKDRYPGLGDAIAETREAMQVLAGQRRGRRSMAFPRLLSETFFPRRRRGLWRRSYSAAHDTRACQASGGRGWLPLVAIPAWCIWRGSLCSRRFTIERPNRRSRSRALGKARWR